jgi:outer membrane protein assembly factor BamB
VRVFDPLWRGLGPGLATGGSLLVASASWLYVTVGRSGTQASLLLFGAGAAGVWLIARVALAQEVAAPTYSSDFRGKRLPWIAAAGCLAGVGLAWWRWPAGAAGAAVGPAWPAALTGFAAAAVGFVLVALRVRTATADRRPGGGVSGTVVAAFVAVAVPVATLPVLATWVRGHAHDSRVQATPLTAPDVTGTPAQRWVVPYWGTVLGGATVPVVWSTTDIRGLEPETGGLRWRLRHDDREATRVRIWNDRIVVTWTVHPTVRTQDERTLRSLVDATSGRVLAETADESQTFVGDRAVARPRGCSDALRAAGSGLLSCGAQVRRIDATGRPLWTAESVPGVVTHLGSDGLLLAASYGFASLDPSSGTVLWRNDRWLDDLVGVTDGVVIWREGGGQGPVRLSGVDLRTGGPLWTRDTGLEAWSSPDLEARGIGAAHHGYVDIVHKGTRHNPAVTRLSARDGTPAGPVHTLDLQTSRQTAPAATGTLLILDTGWGDFRVIGID